MAERKCSFWLKHYLRDRKTYLLLVLAAVFIYFLMFYCYQAEMEGAAYGTLLTAVLFIGTGIVDFSSYRRKGIRLMQLLADPMEEGLPEPGGMTEELYQQLLSRMEEEKRRLMFKNDSDRTEMKEYYTLWVHQIKTPIAAMDLLLQRGEEERDDQLRAELFSISQYVEMALSYVRADDASTDYVIRKCSLEDMVRQAVRKYAGQFVRRKLSLDFQVRDCPVLTDEKWLVFVIEQILSNSLKYTEKGKITIYTEPGPVLVIADTGMGIAAEDTAKDF